MKTFCQSLAVVIKNRTGWLVLVAIVAGASLAAIPSPAAADSDTRRLDQPNYEQALKYSNEYLRQFVYDTAVTPHWVGKTDVFWYSYRTSAGTHWYRVNPRLATREPLFDCMKLGSQLSEMVQKPLDCAQLPLTRESITDDGSKFRFVVDEYQYEYDLVGEKLTKVGRAPAAPAFGPGQGGQGGGR